MTVPIIKCQQFKADIKLTLGCASGNTSFIKCFFNILEVPTCHLVFLLHDSVKAKIKNLHSACQDICIIIMIKSYVYDTISVMFQNQDTMRALLLCCLVAFSGLVTSQPTAEQSDDATAQELPARSPKMGDAR